jgi:hypothetical protein
MTRDECNAQMDFEDGCPCSGDHKHRWEISPHPYDNQFDVFVCDDDDMARRALIDLAEKLWDSADSDNGKQTIKFKLNDVP